MFFSQSLKGQVRGTGTYTVVSNPGFKFNGEKVLHAAIFDGMVTAFETFSSVDERAFLLDDGRLIVAWHVLGESETKYETMYRRK